MASVEGDIAAGVRMVVGDLLASSGLQYRSTPAGAYAAFADAHIEYQRGNPYAQDLNAETWTWDATLHAPDNSATQMVLGGQIKDAYNEEWAIVSLKYMLGKQTALLQRADKRRLGVDRGGAP